MLSHKQGAGRNISFPSPRTDEKEPLQDRAARESEGSSQRAAFALPGAQREAGPGVLLQPPPAAPRRGTGTSSAGCPDPKDAERLRAVWPPALRCGSRRDRDAGIRVFVSGTRLGKPSGPAARRFEIPHRG